MVYHRYLCMGAVFFVGAASAAIAGFDDHGCRS